VVRPVVLFCLALTVMSHGTGIAQNAVGADPVDVTAALTELDEAGTPPTTAEINDFLLTATEPVRGALTGRFARVEGGRWDRTGRLHLSRNWWDVRLRWRQDQWGCTQAAGAVGLGRERWQLVLGQFGLPHGFGLLVGSPGRGPSLTADGSLGNRRRGLVPWLGQARPQTVRGAGGQGSWGGWQVLALVGKRGPRSVSGPVVGVGRISRAGAEWETSVSLVSDPQESGLSVAGRFAHAGLAGCWEAVWRQPVGCQRAVLAVLVQGGWQPRRTVRVEVLSGWSELGPRPVMGVKHPVLGDWAGRGVAVRATWRLAQGLRLKVLVQRADSRQPVMTGMRRQRILSDVQFEGRWRGGWFGGVRARSGGEDIAAWSERFPWQPPKRTGQDRRRVLSCKGGWRRGRERIQVLWRRLVDSRVRQGLGWERESRRNLVGMSGIHVMNAAWVVRVVWTLAWGGEADLVSAVVPFSGYVLPRHWGHWRSEQLLGAEFSHGPVRWRGAISRRWADWAADPAVYADSWTVWLEGGWYW